MSLSALPNNPPSTSGTKMPNTMTRRRSSTFDASQMQFHEIHKREILPYSVHHSLATSKWIATIPRPICGFSDTLSNEKPSVRSFPFDSEKEARRFCRSYSPVKMKTGAKQCGICSRSFGPKCQKYNCRNCGEEVCNTCLTRWSLGMIPKTYLPPLNTSRVLESSPMIRVCVSCDWLSNAFCKALLQGEYENALVLHSTGNINLRCTFGLVNKEAMFPIHCAVLGGNLQLVTWLVEVHSCPLSVKKDKSGMKLSLQTSKSRTLIDLAMTGKPKFEVLSYLIKKNLSVLDASDKSLATKTLDVLLRTGFRFDKRDDDGVPEIDSDLDSSSELSSSATRLENACVICCENEMDCVLSPCGHQICCNECGSRLSNCPICKSRCSVLRVFRL